MAPELTDEMIDAALAKGAAERSKTPVASSVRYDRGAKRIVVDFENGAALAIPAHALQGLEGASDEDIAEVELERGYALHWERLDVDFTIPGLMAGVFGTARYMAANAGRITSEAKAAASRENGKKGGRPRRYQVGLGRVIFDMKTGAIAEAKAKIGRVAGTGQFVTAKKGHSGSRTRKPEKFGPMPIAAFRKDSPKD